MAPGEPRIGVVLGAGGVLGAAWTAGALVALQRRLPVSWRVSSWASLFWKELQATPKSSSPSLPRWQSVWRFEGGTFLQA